jgi:hypothetical protein
MATNTLDARLLHCIKTASEWASDTTVLLKGEIGIEADTLKIKFGDGTKTYSNLAYSNVTPAELTDIIKAYAPLASPAFTGVPTAPTANSDTNTTQIATTAFVMTAVGNAFDSLTGVDYQKYDSYSALPTTGAKGVIYLVPDIHSDSNDTYDEYMWFDSKYEKIGNTDVDLSGYQVKITGAATTILTANLTAARVLVSDENGKVVVSTITSTELGYLGGVTANIQEQLNNKASKDHTHSIGITGGATAEAVNAGESTVSLNVKSVSTSVLAVPSGDTLVLNGNF